MAHVLENHVTPWFPRRVDRVCLELRAYARGIRRCSNDRRKHPWRHTDRLDSHLRPGAVSGLCRCQSCGASAVGAVFWLAHNAVPAAPEGVGAMGVAVSGAEPAILEPGLDVHVRKRLSGPRNSETSFQLDVRFMIEAGFTVLFGASGAGKTTVLDCIAGLQEPDSGRIAVDSVALVDSEHRINIPAHRRNIGYLFQTLALFPHMTVRQNIEYGLSSLSRSERDGRTSEIGESFGISGLFGRRPSEISGGERQRVALARALVTRPRALLLDEPLTALDAVTKSRILDDLRRWNDRHSVPILYVTHDREEVHALGDRLIVLEAGKSIADGRPQDVLHRPQYESVAQL